MYKSCGFCAIFQLFGVASIRLRLLFEGGLYAKSRVFKTRKSGFAHVKWKWNLTLRLFQNYFNFKQTVGMWKAVWFRPTSTTPGPFLQAAASVRVRLMCSLSSKKMRLLFECGFQCGFYTRLYGSRCFSCFSCNHWCRYRGVIWQSGGLRRKKQLLLYYGEGA